MMLHGATGTGSRLGLLLRPASSASRPASPSSTSPSTTPRARYRPVQEIAEASQTGPATNIISGIAVGFETTAVTAITIAIALFASFWLGTQANLTSDARRQRRRPLRHRGRDDGHAHDDRLHPGDGHVRPDHRQRRWHRRVRRHEARGARHITDGLDAVGNTTKALTKGYAVGSAALAAFLLFSAYLDEINLIQGRRIAAGARAPSCSIRSTCPTSTVFIGGVARCHAGLLLQLAGDQRGRQDGPDDHRRGPPPVPRDARDHGLQPAAGLRSGRRHHHRGRAPPDDRCRASWPCATPIVVGVVLGSRRSPAC